MRTGPRDPSPPTTAGTGALQSPVRADAWETLPRAPPLQDSTAGGGRAWTLPPELRRAGFPQLSSLAQAGGSSGGGGGVTWGMFLRTKTQLFVGGSHGRVRDQQKTTAGISFTVTETLGRVQMFKCTEVA